MVNEGSFDYDSNTWTASSESGSSAVLFSNPTTMEPQIMSVTVYYTTTSEVLEPSKAEIIEANGEPAKTYSAAATEVLQVPSFKSLDLTFPYDISPLDLAAITMKDAKDNAVEIAFNAIKENAKKFNEMREKIQNIRKKFENTYDGRIINGDIKDELAYQEIMMDNWKERLDKITSELGLNPSPSNSAVAQYGS